MNLCRQNETHTHTHTEMVELGNRHLRAYSASVCLLKENENKSSKERHKKYHCLYGMPFENLENLYAV